MSVINRSTSYAYGPSFWIVRSLSALKQENWHAELLQIGIKKWQMTIGKNCLQLSHWSQKLFFWNRLIIMLKGTTSLISIFYKFSQRWSKWWGNSNQMHSCKLNLWEDYGLQHQRSYYDSVYLIPQTYECDKVHKGNKKWK